MQPPGVGGTRGQAKLGDDADFNTLWQKFNLKPLRKLTRRVSDGDLLGDLRTAVNVRNHLAHNYFWFYVIRRAHGGLSLAGAVEELGRVSGKFGKLTEELEDLFHELLRDQGVEPPKDAEVWFKGFEEMDLWPDRGDEETARP